MTSHSKRIFEMTKKILIEIKNQFPQLTNELIIRIDIGYLDTT